MVAQPNSGIRILRMKHVMERTNMCRSYIYLRMKEGNFPASVRLGEKAVGWYEHDIDAWLSSRVSTAPVIN